MPTTLTETESYGASVVGPATGDARTSAGVRLPSTTLASRTLWLWKRLQEVIGTFAPVGHGNAPMPIGGVDTTIDVIRLESHGFATNDEIVFIPATGGVLPAPLVAGTTYFAIRLADDDLQVSLTSGGSAINLTTAGSGDVYIALRVTPSLYGYAALAAAANTFTGNIGIGGTTRAVGTVTCEGAVNVAGTMSLGYTSLMGAGPAMTLNMDVSHTGRYKPRATVPLTDADHTIGSSDGGLFAIAAPSASRTITLRETTAPVPSDGEEITISRPASGAFTVVIVREGGGTLITLAASKRTSVTVVYMDINDGGGAKWRVKHALGASGTEYTLGAAA